MNWAELLADLFKSGTMAALVTGVILLVDKALERRAKRKEKEAFDAEAEITSVKEFVRKNDNNLSDLKTGLKYVLYAQIRALGLQYLEEGQIGFDDREVLNDMHKSYHNGLGGNGDLDILMKSVNELPLKLHGKEQ